MGGSCEWCNVALSHTLTCDRCEWCNVALSHTSLSSALSVTIILMLTLKRLFLQVFNVLIKQEQPVLRYAPHVVVYAGQCAHEAVLYILYVLYTLYVLYITMCESPVFIFLITIYVVLYPLTLILPHARCQFIQLHHSTDRADQGNDRYPWSAVGRRYGSPAGSLTACCYSCGPEHPEGCPMAAANPEH